MSYWKSNEHLPHTNHFHAWVIITCLFFRQQKINYIATNWQFTLGPVVTRFPIRRWMEPQASAKACFFPLKVTLRSGCQSSQSGGLRCDSGLQICFCFRCQGERRRWTNNARRPSHTHTHTHTPSICLWHFHQSGRKPASDFRHSFTWGKTGMMVLCGFTATFTFAAALFFPLPRVAVNVWQSAAHMSCLKPPDSANNCTESPRAFWRGAF